MSVIGVMPWISSVSFIGLEKLNLPFTTYVFGGATDDSNTNYQLGLHDEDKYYVKSITGLEPPDRDVAIARTASGGQFQGVTTGDREIVVLIGLNPDWDAGETPRMLRNELYTMLNTGYDPKIDIVMYQGALPICHEYAYVSKFEASIWDSDPAVQITFTTLNPTFRAMAPFQYNPADLSETDPDIFNFGTAETGFMFAVKFTDDKANWFINTSEDQNIGMFFENVFHTGDVLSVSTILGQRYVHLKKSRGKVQNALNLLTSDSEWLQLHPGHNHFKVPLRTGAWDWNGYLSFTPQYWGI